MEIDRQLARVHGAAPTDWVSFAFKVRGLTDSKLWLAAIDAVINSHDALLQVFPEWATSDYCVLGVVDTESHVVVLHDRCDRAQIEAIARHQTLTQRSLDAWPLFQLTLVVDEESSSTVLVGAFEHIVFDGWSAREFVSAVVKRYLRQLGHGRPGKEGASFQSYIAAQTAWLNTDPGKATFDRLVNSLPADFPVSVIDLGGTHSSGSPVDEYASAYVQRVLPPALSRAVAESCRMARVTPYVFLLGALARVAAEYSAGDRIVILSPMSGRLWTPWTRSLGFFSNLTPIALSRDALQSVPVSARSAALDALQGQMVPFALIRSRRYPHLFGSRLNKPYIMFDFVPEQALRFAVESVEVEEMSLGEALPTRLDPGLNITVSQSRDQFTFDLLWSTEVGTYSAVEQLFELLEKELTLLCRLN